MSFEHAFVAAASAVHAMPMSSRLTKKSLVSVPGRVGEDPVLDSPVIGAQHAQAADQHRHFRRGERQQLGAIDQQFLGRPADALAHVVAEAVGDGLQHGERLDVGLRRRASVRPGVKGT